MNKVGDHRAKCTPLFLLCCNKPRGLLRAWKVTTSSLVSKLSNVSGIWFLDFSCLHCMDANDSYKYLSELCSPRWFRVNSQNSGHSCSLQPHLFLSPSCLLLPSPPPPFLPQLVLSGKIVSCLFPCPYSLYWMFVRSGLRSYTASKALIIFACITIYWIDVSFQ